MITFTLKSPKITLPIETFSVNSEGCQITGYYVYVKEIADLGYVAGEVRSKFFRTAVEGSVMRLEVGDYEGDQRSFNSATLTLKIGE